jgi:hypothetical protein
VTILGTSEKGKTLTVIVLVDLPQVREQLLNIGRLLEVFKPHRRHIYCAPPFPLAFLVLGLVFLS